MIILRPPLAKIRLTQPFGVNYGPTPDFYTKLGLKAHNGLDFSAPIGTTVFAVMDGDMKYEEGLNGYGRNIRIRNRELGLEAIYGHLLKPLLLDGPVLAGNAIAYSGNTGYSTGPHLHFGLRKIEWRADGSGPHRIDPNNGFFGCIDPMPFFGPEFLLLPVDHGYGNKTPASVLEFAPHFLTYLRANKGRFERRDYLALRYGYWPLRDVLDPAMHSIVTEMTYPEARKRGIVS